MPERGLITEGRFYPLPNSSMVQTSITSGMVLIVVVAGRLYARTRFERHIVPGPSLCLLNAASPHELRSDAGTHGFYAELSEPILDRIGMACISLEPGMFSEIGDRIRIIPIEKTEIQSISSRIDPRTGESDYRAPDMEMLEIARLLLEFLPSIAPRSYRNRIAATHGISDRSDIHSIAWYIDNHFEEQFTLATLADMCDLSPSYFARAFKQTHGLPVFEYLHRARVRKACLLLKRTTKPVLEISTEIGYNNVSFFNRCFRRITGTTPIEYRRS